MGILDLFLRKRTKITCPLCKKGIDIKEAKEKKEIEIIGKDIEGYIHIKHKGFCGAHIVWDTLSGKTFEKDIQDSIDLAEKYGKKK